MLSQEEKVRYSRHLMLDDVGEEGQEKIKKGSVLIIGCGALGSPNALYLAGAGIGKIGLVDDDAVDISNLHRQVMYRTSDIGISKTQSAKNAIFALNPSVEVEIHSTRFNIDNAFDLIMGYDFIIDASDNFVTKFLVNQACVLAQKPYAHAGIVRYMGQSMTYYPNSVCLGCLFPTPPKDASLYKMGLFGTLTGILGSIQASEALKYFTGVGTPLTNSLLNLDISNMTFRKVKITKNPDCPVCGKHSSKELTPLSCNS
ncbi:HesA/MoeB/ThiF family protein [Helicobacter pylori]